MNTETVWLPILYRDFYDVPRMFVVLHAGATYLFDCPFCEDSDDYAEDFSVYRMPDNSVAATSLDDWSSLPSSGLLFGTIPVRDVHFDASRRTAIHISTFDRMRPQAIDP